MSTCDGADFFERENSEIVVEEAARRPILNRTSERVSVSLPKERRGTGATFLPREARRSEEGDRPSPRWFDRGIPAKGGPRRVEPPHLVIETRTLTVIPLPEGCGGSS